MRASTTSLWILLSFVTSTLWGQASYVVDAITTADGLSQGVGLDIFQDSEGFLWIGTKDGLNRYDGQNFLEFTYDPNDPWSIGGNMVDLIYEDSKGYIWTASANAGISIYDKKTGRFHRIQHDPNDPASISDNNIGSIVEDSSGYFIISITGVGVNMLQLSPDFFKNNTPPKVIRVPLPQQPQLKNAAKKEVRSLIKDHKGRIWVGGEDGIFKMDVAKASLKLVVEGFSFDQAYAHPDGSIWGASSNHSLFRWDGKHVFRVMEDVFDVNDCQVDEKGNLWIGWSNELLGLNLTNWKPGDVLSPEHERCFYRWAPTRNGDSLNFPFKSMHIDRSGLIWLGTNGYGLFTINPSRRIFGHGLKGKSIRHFETDMEGTSFLAITYQPGFYLPSGKKFKTPACNGCQEVPDMLLVSNSGHYWMRDYMEGENYSLVRVYDTNENLIKKYKLPWNHIDFQPMVEGKDGAIYMAGYEGVFTRLDPTTDEITSFSLRTGQLLPDAGITRFKRTLDYSTVLYEDEEGWWWIGSEMGFIKCKWPKPGSQTIKTIQYQNEPKDTTSLSSNQVSSFMKDPFAPGRYVWIGTKGGGLNRFDKVNQTFLRIGPEQGLPDRVVYGTLSDQDGNIWGSTNKGLFCIFFEKKETSEITEFSIRVFSKEDGLQEEEFNTDAFAKLKDGRLAFGGVNGYNIFDPKEVMSPGYAPPVYITGLLINNQPIKPGDPTGILSSTIETSNSITLNHLQDIITLEFASLDFQAPDRVQYRYQLEGATDGWIEAGKQRSATFLRLPPNEYTFRVQGSNSQGVWSDKIASLKINVLPPWWKTSWAYAAYILLFLGLLWLIFRFFIRRTTLQQQLSFQKREAERVRELDTLKTQLYMNMTHEFRTPLTIILGMAQQVIEDPKTHFRQGMEMIIDNGQNLLEMVNRMLSLSKLENRKMTLDLVQDDIMVFLRRRAESFRSFAANKNIQLHFLPEVDSLLMDYDPEKLQQIVSNLLSNAFKFTPENGHIYFGIRQEGNMLAIRIKDTGLGIEPKDLKKVFDRFYQADISATRKNEGTGIGLALCRELVNLMQGEISVQSPPTGVNCGTEFTVKLPIYTNATLVKMDYDQKSGLDIKINGRPKEAPAIVLNETDQSTDSEAPVILLAEDNPDVVKYVASCLTDYQLHFSSNGKEAFELATNIIPDLVVSDVMMPIMDGFELCEQLKTDSRTNHIPIVILTARADLESKLEGLGHGANAYLPKPFEKKELLLTIKNLFQLREKLQMRYQNQEVEEDSGLVTTIEEAEDPFVQQVRQLIEIRIDDLNLTVEALSKELLLSHSQLARKLNALTGYSPNRFIRHIRFKRAKMLLLDETLSVANVAYSCGFNDPDYFSRAFKKEFGKTPVEWREISKASQV
jgi:signal transduction histidine kinase/CheY-like chemotaxis protein/AraC-like DNA-binding protein/ligand-binding sensor domain-containing protein